MLTAKDGEYDEAEALDTGADDYVTKPFSYVAPVARLRALIRRGSAERPPCSRSVICASIRAPDGHWRGETEVRLTARGGVAARVPAAARGRGRVEVRDPRACLGRSVRGDLNIVEVYMRHLRNKLDRPFGRASIETLRGAGYRLVADGG